MAECWRVSPSARPTFFKIAEAIGQYLSDQIGYVEIHAASETTAVTNDGYEVPI